MNKKTFYRLIAILFFSFFFANNAGNDQVVKLEIYQFNNIEYIRYNQFVELHQLRNNYYPSKDKYEIIHQRNKIYLSPFSTFCKINNNIYQMIAEPVYKNNQLYIPIESFYKILALEYIPIEIFEKTKKELLSSTVLYTINGVKVENKQNGTFVSLITTKKFNIQNISSTTITDHGWLNITILNGKVDSLAIAQSRLDYPIKQVRSIQMKESAQISLQLKGKYDKVTLSSTNKSIDILLQTNISENITKLKELKDRWMINTIVIDAGHGGKDPGCTGYNIKEKEVTLDIAKKLGNLLEKKLNVDVIYTREEDVFIPLWKRTQIANSNNADLFISIHANAVSKHQGSTYGFETYLISMDKSQKATETVKRENEVIKLEQQINKYNTDFSTSTILPNMLQNANMKTSEQLASLIQKNLSRNLTSKDRGVKQAGFQVLWGATMPNVLVEVGFLTHPKESKKLNTANYRNKIAKSIFDAIKTFKVEYEK